MSGEAIQSAPREAAGSVSLPDEREFRALLRLLDDDTPAVREAVMEKIRLLDGDVSEWCSDSAIELDPVTEELLSKALSDGRRRKLLEEWQAPSGGAAAFGEDWDHLECLLRMLSDFLHDGVTLRQPLSDMLDLLADEAEHAGIDSPESLRVFLFEAGTYVGNESDPSDPRNLDLAWVGDAGRSDALGLSLLYVLVARRLGVEVEPVDYPGHFFCLIHEKGRALLVDCFDYGRIYPLEQMLRGHDIGRAEKRCLSSTVGPGTVLLRVLHDLIGKLEHQGRDQDAALVAQLREML